MAKKKNSAGIELFIPKGGEGIFSAIISRLKNRIGERGLIAEPKKTCAHLIAEGSGTAFAGLHPRKAAVLLNIRLQKPIKSARVRKVERVSTNRFHCEVVLASESDVDLEVVEWLENAWRLASQGR